MNALMLLIALRIAGCRLKLLRMLAGAALGAFAAALVRVLELPRGMQAWLWLPLAAGMMGVAGGRRMMVRPLLGAGLLLCAGGLLGGVVQALYGATGLLWAAYALGALSAVWIAACALRTMKTEEGKRRAQVTLCYRGRSACFDAIIDSGNTLRDYLSHAPVIVLPGERSRRALGLEGAALRPIFANTAGGRQMLDCFLPEKTEILLDGKRLCVQAAAAFAPGLTEVALVPPALIAGMQETGNNGDKRGTKSEGGASYGKGAEDERGAVGGKARIQADQTGGNGGLYRGKRFAAAAADEGGGGAALFEDGAGAGSCPPDADRA